MLGQHSTTYRTKMSLEDILLLVRALDELTSKYIVDTLRLQKGLRLFLEGKAEYRASLDTWIVASQSEAISQDGGDVYAVDLDLGLCSCADASNRDVLCKHFIAAWLTHRLAELRKKFQFVFQSFKGAVNR